MCSVLVCGSIANFCQTIFSGLDNSHAFAGFYLVSTMLGLWSVFLQIYCWCADPGVITIYDKTTSYEATLEYLSLDSEEKEVYDTDPIYQEDTYYKYRNCDTCKLNRPAKASHCNVCGHCVRGWDHHCIAIANCVGRRNFRSFVLYLMVSSFWAF